MVTTVDAGTLRKHLESIDDNRPILFVIVRREDDQYLQLSFENNGIGVKVDHKPIGLDFVGAGKLLLKNGDVIDSVFLMQCTTNKP